MAKLLSICVLVVCLYDALILALLPSTVMLMALPDGSMARCAANVSCLLIAGLIMVKDGLKPFLSPWLLALVGLAIYGHFQSPNIQIDSAFLPKDMAIYDYKPMLEMILLLLLVGAVASLPKLDDQFIYQALGWLAIAYSLYIICQRLHMDQLYVPAEATIEHESRHPEAGGFICQPVFAAALVVMLLPFLLQLKRYAGAAFCIVGILLTGNRAAEFAALFCILFHFPKTQRVAMLVAIGYPTFLAINLIVGMTGHFILYDERFTVWVKVLHDMVHPAFPGVHHAYILTGFGLGSFPVFFPFYHQSGYYQAHNEYIEAFYTLGILGVFFVMRAIAHLLMHTRCDAVLRCSIIVCLLLACTNATWHIAQLSFITALLVGMAYRQTRSTYDLAHTTGSATKPRQSGECACRSQEPVGASQG